MNNHNEEGQWDFSFLGKVGGSVLENAAFILGAFLLFSRTSDLMTAFAPASFLGYTGIEAVYGMLSALMVEGLLFSIKFSIGRSRNSIAWVWNIILLAVTFGISALAQSIDSFVVRETLTSQPAEIQWAISWGVPLIPAIVVGVLMVKSVFDSIPPGALEGLVDSVSRAKNKAQGDDYPFPKQIGAAKKQAEFAARQNGRQGGREPIPEQAERGGGGHDPKGERPE